MKNIAILPATLIFLLLFLSGCELVGTIFKTGMGVGVIIVVIVIALVLYLFRKRQV
jgi:hypothetical protein